MERGEFLPRERDNWDAAAVFAEAKYQVKETGYGKDGRSFHPGLHYWVGGNTKVYGAALLQRQGLCLGIDHSAIVVTERRRSR